MAELTLRVGPKALLSDIERFFRQRGMEAYLTGGFLRDALLGRESRDIDVTIAGDPLALGPELADALSGSYFPLAEEQQIARVVLAGAHVDLTPLRGDLQSDLGGRDYTIDAMAAPLSAAASGSAEVIDTTGGLGDLHSRVVRVTGEEAFRRDALRPLRGARLAVELGFTIESLTADLIRKHAHRLPETAVERQREELMRIMATSRAGDGLRLLDDLGLLEHLLPEVTDIRGVEQPKEHHWDVFDHSLEAVRNLDVLMAETEPDDPFWRPLWDELWGQTAWWEGARDYFREDVVPDRPRLAVLKLGGLLHDIAKPETKMFDDKGRMRFFGHAAEGSDKAARILRRLRFSGREVALVRAMVKAHLRPVQMAQQGEPSRRAIYRYFRDCGDAAVDTLFLSLADHLGTVGPRVDPAGWRQHVALVNYILVKSFREKETVEPPKLLGGDDLMRELNLSPGPLVGRLLEILREAQAAGEISTREQALALARASAEQARSHRSHTGGDLA